MALVVEDGSRKENAESYASVTDADAYVTKWHDPTDWNNATQTAKERALRRGTRLVDDHRFFGEPTDTRQALAWPRRGLDAFTYDVAWAYGGPINGKTFESDEVPADIVAATIEAALRDVKGETLFPDHDGGTVRSESKEVGSLKKQTEFASPQQARRTFEAIEALLRPYVLSSSRRLLRV